MMESQPVRISYVVRRKWSVFVAVSLMFFFLNLATFTSLGVVLYTMVAQLHWSLTAAGVSFALLGIGCGLFSPVAAMVIGLIGARLTICVGAALLLAGFLAASVCQGVAVFYLAMLLVGIGYALAGNVAGICLIASWFTTGSARIVGYYYMIGALGSAFGPPIVHLIVGQGGWRGHWQAMAATSVLVGLASWVLVRDAPGSAAGRVDQDAAPSLASGWTQRQAIFTWQFLLVAGTMTATMAAVTTLNSVATLHFVRLGATPAAAAFVLSFVAVCATLVKGAAGRACEAFSATAILGAGMAAQALGCLLLGGADTPLLQYAGALVFGAGWGLAFVASTVVLLDYFGPLVGSRILAVVWLITTLAAAGPVAAGMIADRTGSYAAMFDGLAGMFLLLALPVLMMRRPARQPRVSTVAG